MRAPYVVRNIPRLDPSIAAGLAELGVATVRLREVLSKQGVTYVDWGE